MSDAPIVANIPSETPNTNNQAAPKQEAAPKKPSREESIYSKEKAADQKFREAAELKKQVAEFESKLANDPESFFNDPRIPKQKRREIAEKLLMKELEEEFSPQLTAEQREIEELRKFKKSKDDEEMSAKEKEQQAQFQKVVDKRREDIAATFQEAISHTALSKHEGTSAEVVREMAIYARLCRQAGYNPSPKEIAEHVESRFMSSYQGLTETLSGEDLVKFLGKGIIKKLRDYDLQQLESRKPKSEPQQATEWQSRDERSSKRDFASPKDLLKQNRGK
jgi:Fe2+ transport system protein B